MNDAGAAIIGIGAIVLLLFVALIAFPFMDEVAAMPAGDYAVVPAGDVVADCGAASSVGDEACNLQVAEFSSLDGLLVLGGGALLLIAGAGLLFLLALGLSSL